jgi:T-complex protein 1 subunit delta
MQASQGGQQSAQGGRFQEKSKEHDVRQANMIAAKGVADAVRSSLGPKGMDKMIQSKDGEVIITNDGATIMSHMQVFHPTAKMLVELSRAQDVECGDGTTSVVVLCGSLLEQAQNLLSKGIHPTVVTEAFSMAQEKCVEVMRSMAIPVDLTQRDQLLKAAQTSLASKVVSNASEDLAPLAVDAVLKVIDAQTATNVDLNNVRIVKALGGTIDETELVEGLVFTNRMSHTSGGPTKVANAKIGLVQFCLSAPKTDIENQVVISEYSQMDRILKEERKYILDLCKKVQATGCNVLLVQKSILRDALNDLSLNYLAKLKILVVKDVERDDIEFICKTLGTQPVAHIDHFTADKLGAANLVEECSVGPSSKVVKVTGVPHKGRTISMLIRGSNRLVLDETDRSLHDALCVVRSIVKQRFLIAGGGAPEIECSLQLSKWAKTLTGMHATCVSAFADALEVIPYTLAENAGMNPISIVTELRKRHAEGLRTAGINVRKSVISDILEENVVQPLLVSTSAITLATETVRLILKIDGERREGRRRARPTRRPLCCVTRLNPHPSSPPPPPQTRRHGRCQVIGELWPP